MERTFMMIKPDGVHRSLVGDIISRVERKGYRISAMKMLMMDEELASRHYSEHREKPFFRDLISFITSGPVVVMVVEGEDAVEGVRRMMGMTDPGKSQPGTIRGDLAVNLSRNVVHGSDSRESASREISIFFEEKEIVHYRKVGEDWVYP